ncbi:MAG TPA: winged helix-turn-helix domain-containing protein [Sphingomicrobium sp.]|nr:winged helix-turn-helix domain-containing protein [Sphingomicrobium sp.]
MNSHVVIVLAHEEPFHIGSAIVRPATREIEYDGRTAILEPRVMQVLVALWRAAGQVVSKDDLIERCWNGRIVGDDAINRVMSRLRHNAQDDAGGAFRIETVTRVGYRLRCAECDDTEPALPQELDRRAVMAGGGALVLLAGVAAAWRYNYRSAPDLPPDVAALLAETKTALDQGMPDDYANAVSKARQAVARKPDSAATWGTLALAYSAVGSSSPDNEYDANMARAKSAAARALAIDPKQGDALAAQVHTLGLSDFAAIDRALQAAYAKAPDNAAINGTLGIFYSLVGRISDSVAPTRRAMEIADPAPRRSVSLVMSLWELGRLEEAEAELERAFGLWPRFYAIWFTRLYYLALHGRATEALGMMDSTASRPLGIPDWNFALTRLQLVAFQTRARADIDRAMTALMKASEKGTGFVENAAVFAAHFGMTERALSLVERFFDKPPADGLRFSKEQGLYSPRKKKHCFILWHPELGPVRAHPRFSSITSRLGLEDYWRTMKVVPDYRRG